MREVSESQSGLNGSGKSNEAHRWVGLTGWTVAIAGLVLWGYGLYADEEMVTILDWPGFTPHWIASAFPNWFCELGLVLSAVGTGPVYYTQIKERLTG